MRAAVFNSPEQPWSIETVPDPVPLAGEAIIKVGRCGICGSDLGMTSGEGHTVPCGSILGHEYAGEVVELGTGETQLRVGDLISVLPARGCGRCAQCLGGEPVLCSQMMPYMGGFAEFMRIPQEGAFRLPDGLSLADGALVEPLAVGLHAVRLANMRPGARVLVHGAGAVALAVIFWARRLGAGKIVVASRSKRRAPLSVAFGADAFIETSNESAANTVEALQGQAEIAFECVGQPGMLAHAMNSVGANGKIVSLGACMRPETVISGLATMRQAQLIFSMAYRVDEFKFVLDFLERGHLEPREMVSRTIPLDGLPAMIDRLRTASEETKVHVDPSLP